MVAMRDECSLVWSNPRDLADDAATFPEPPEFRVSAECVLGSNSGWASTEEAERAGHLDLVVESDSQR